MNIRMVFLDNRGIFQKKSPLFTEKELLLDAAFFLRVINFSIFESY